MVTMLQPGAYAPTGESLEQKLLELGGRGSSSSSTTCTPISFIYGGTKDWMTSAHGARVVDTLRQRADADAASGGGGGDPHHWRPAAYDRGAGDVGASRHARRRGRV